MTAWTPPLAGLGMGLLIGFMGVALSQVLQADVAEQAQHAHEQLQQELHLANDQLRRFDERWLAQTHQAPPDPVLPPPPSPPLDAPQFRERLLQSLALNGLQSAQVSETTSQDVRVTVSARIDALLALVVQMDDAAPSSRLKAWSIRCEDPLCQAPLNGQLTWQLQRPPGQQAKGHAFVGAAPQGALALHDPFDLVSWWRRNVDEAPMAKGASRRQWQKDMQAAEAIQLDNRGPWVWLGWVGRREGRRALVQIGDEAMPVRLGQAVSREPMVIESMDPNGLHLRQWALNEQGRWQVSRTTHAWVKPQ